MNEEELFEELVMRYGLEHILEENDIEPAFALKLLYQEGYIDMEANYD